MSGTSLVRERAAVIVAAAVSAAKRLGRPQCIAVVDDHGDLLVFERMDGARLMSIDTSIAKARTAARTGSPTGRLDDHVGLAVALATSGAFTELRGGLPIEIDGVIVGAIGVGSGTPDEDVAVASAGIDALRGSEVGL